MIYIIETEAESEVYGTDVLPPGRPSGNVEYRQVLASSKEEAEKNCDKLYFERVVAGPFDENSPEDVKKVRGYIGD